MIEMLKDMISGFPVKAQEKRIELEERISKIEATLDGEDKWMLEKSGTKRRFKCDCDCEEE